MENKSLMLGQVELIALLSIGSVNGHRKVFYKYGQMQSEHYLNDKTMIYEHCFNAISNFKDYRWMTNDKENRK